jgi:hypothetical protein
MRRKRTKIIKSINQIRFWPLFKNDIPGFLLEERTVADYGWSGIHGVLFV